MPQLQQINELNNDSRTKKSSIKQASMLQQHQLSQRSVYEQQQQQLKTGSILPFSTSEIGIHGFIADVIDMQPIL